jgi:hypothetical protein
MKTPKLIILITMLLLLSASISYSQMYGKWIVPYYSEYGEAYYKTYQLSFTETGIMADELGDEYIQIESAYGHLFSGGAYNANYDLVFYIINNMISDSLGNSFEFSNTPSFLHEYICPEFQIIPRPGTLNQYIVIYTIEMGNAAIISKYFIVSINENTGELEIEIPTPDGFNDYDDLYAAFAISEEINDSRYVYTVGSGTDDPPYTGLIRFLSDANGFGEKTWLFTPSNTGLTSKDFEAYNMEMKTSGDTYIFAWIHGTENSYQNWHVDEIVVINGDTDQVFDLSLGRIGGIEFSHFEDNILYASCTDRGIVKLNYVTGELSDVYAPATPDYSRTFLQTAPDGHIYAVSNDGTKLGRILQHGNNAGSFQADVFTSPTGGSITTYKTFGNQRYYILPENERIHTPLEISVYTEPETCPGDADGRAEIHVSGGVPFDNGYPYLISSNPSLNWFWDAAHFYFYSDNLSEGIYEYTLSDANTPDPNVWSGSFEIELDNSQYSFQNNFLEITSNTTLPNAGFPDDFYSFEKGIHINAGATLTINNSIYEFGHEAVIIVEPGAKLIVNNTTLTNSKFCSDNLQLWKGVRVHGNKQQSQWPDAQGNLAQGYLELNDAVIENAIDAVVLWKPGDYATTGGIVIANNSIFRNNKKAVHALNYRNYNPATGQEMDYRALFADCDFVINTNYLGTHTFSKHVDLSSVKGVRFTACNFNLATDAPNVSAWNMGIGAYSAGFHVNAKCNNSTIPCNDW